MASKSREAFEKDLASVYEFTPDILEAIGDLFDKHSKPKKEKRKRQDSAYNAFVKDHMKKDDIKALNNKDRMRAIANKWKNELSKFQREMYKALHKRYEM